MSGTQGTSNLNSKSWESLPTFTVHSHPTKEHKCHHQRRCHEQALLQCKSLLYRHYLEIILICAPLLVTVNSILLLFSTVKTLELSHHLYREKLKELLNAEIWRFYSRGGSAYMKTNCTSSAQNDEVGIKKLLQL